MDLHIKILGILYVIFGFLRILLGIAVITLLTIGGIASLDTRILALLGIAGTVIGTILIVFGLARVISGIGLLLRKKWSRVYGIIMAILSLLSIPFGTMLGVYGLWVLFKPESEQLLTA